MTTRREQRILLGRLRVTLADLEAQRAELEEVCGAFNTVIAYLEKQVGTEPAPRVKPVRPKPEREIAPLAGKPATPTKPPKQPKQPVPRPTRAATQRRAVYGSDYGPDGLYRPTGSPEMVTTADGRPLPKSIRERLHAARDGRRLEAS